MAVASSRVRPDLARQWRDRDTSPERTKVWTQPPRQHKAAATAAVERKVPVVYYLSRNGHLEHPHFMEVTLSSSDGLYLRDVIDRLNLLRGKGMASLYSWSSKRSYKNGFVWHDLTEDDFIYPAHGHEYVLKGSEHLQVSPLLLSDATTASSSSSEEISKSAQGDDGSEFSLVRRKKKTPWSSLDLGEYKVYKADSTAEAALKATDAATQTDDRRQWRRAAAVAVRDEGRSEVPNPEADEDDVNPTSELCRDEISPPPSSSSPETLETLIKANGRLANASAIDESERAMYPSGRARASAVLINLISCGAISVKDDGLSLVPHYRPRLQRGGSMTTTDLAAVAAKVDDSHCFPAPRLEDKEYFSGSLIETKKKGSDGGGEFASLKRSSSYNADRSSKLDLAEKEIEGVRAKCIPRRPRPVTGRKETGSILSRSSHGSKRISSEEVPK